MSNPETADLEKEITESVQRCWKCRMCVAMCPTYEGWFTQSTAGRLMAINLYIKHLCTLSVISFSRSAVSGLLIPFSFQVPGIKNIIGINRPLDTHKHCMGRHTVSLLEKGDP